MRHAATIYSVILTLGLGLFLPAVCYAEDRYSFILEKQEKKKEGRWSFADWIEQRDKRRMMDLWLAMHSPSPYEFYFGVDYTSGRESNTGYFKRWQANVAAYAFIFGVEAQWQDSMVSNGFTGLGHIRIFGLHAQATNITLVGGLAQQNRGPINMINPVVGASTTIYISRYAGVDAHYRHFVSHTRNNETLFSNNWQLGAFIDFQYVRIYGGWMTQREGGSLARSPSGFHLGTRFYF